MTIITFYNAATDQFYIRLHPQPMEDDEKTILSHSMNAKLACEFPFGEAPKGINLLFFQEFETNDTDGVYHNINGDRQVYDLVHNYWRNAPDYQI